MRHLLTLRQIAGVLCCGKWVGVGGIRGLLGSIPLTKLTLFLCTYGLTPGCDAAASVAAMRQQSVWSTKPWNHCVFSMAWLRRQPSGTSNHGLYSSGHSFGSADLVGLKKSPCTWLFLPCLRRSSLSCCHMPQDRLVASAMEALCLQHGMGAQTTLPAHVTMACISVDIRTVGVLCCCGEWAGVGGTRGVSEFIGLTKL